MNVVLLRRLFYSCSRGDSLREHSIRKYSYVRLTSVSAVGTTLAIPLLLFFIIKQSSSLLRWVSWENTHAGAFLTECSNFLLIDEFQDYSRIGQYTALQWRQGPDASLMIFSRWLNVLCAAIWLLFFAYTPDTARFYGPFVSRAYHWLPLPRNRGKSDPGSGTALPTSSARFHGTTGTVANWFATIGSGAAVNSWTGTEKMVENQHSDIMSPEP